MFRAYADLAARGPVRIGAGQRDPERNGWTIAQQAGDRTPDRTQRLLNRAVWDGAAAMSQVRRFVVTGLDAVAGRRARRGLRIAALDETGQAKQGTATCGVKRQYMGCAGRLANGINTVHLAYVRERVGHALIGARQWIPGRLGRERLSPPAALRESMAPLARWMTGAPFPVPAPADLAEAFRWSEHRTVSKTALVSLHGNRYQVDPQLVGRRVELVFDPFDLTFLRVRLDGADAGAALPFQINRHSHPKARPEVPAEEPKPTTGIDYLALIDARHSAELANKVNYAAFGPPPEQPADLSDTASPDTAS